MSFTKKKTCRESRVGVDSEAIILRPIRLYVPDRGESGRKSNKMTGCAVRLMLLLAVASMAGWGISVDPGITYSTPNNPSLASVNAVGIPFYVHTSFYFEDLGAYDFGSNGVTGPITVSVHKWSGAQNDFAWLGDPNNVVAQVTIQSAPQNQTVGEVSWKALSTPVTLSPGWYVLYARGFNASDPTINNPGYSLNTFGGAITYGQNQGGYYWQFINYAWVSGSVPIFVAGGSLSVPEPSTYALMASVGIALYVLRRRRSQAAKN